jgi:DNA mismatch repair ATPase MutL
MQRIAALPEAVALRLRAGPAAVDVPQCVDELVLNSIDAGATVITVEV